MFRRISRGNTLGIINVGTALRTISKRCKNVIIRVGDPMLSLTSGVSPRTDLTQTKNEPQSGDVVSAPTTSLLRGSVAAHRVVVAAGISDPRSIFCVAISSRRDRHLINPGCLPPGVTASHAISAQVGLDITVELFNLSEVGLVTFIPPGDKHPGLQNWLSLRDAITYAIKV